MTILPAGSHVTAEPGDLYFQTDVCNAAELSLKHKAKKQSVKLGEITMKVRLVSEGPFDTAAKAPLVGTRYAFLDTKSQPQPGTWNNFWTKSCADIDDKAWTTTTFKQAGYYAIYFQCVFDAYETKQAVADGKALPNPWTDFEPPSFKQIVHVRPGKPKQFKLEKNFQFRNDGMFEPGMRIGAEEHEEIELVLTDAFDNPIKVEHRHIRALSIKAIARKGTAKFSTHMDRSRGLKVSPTSSNLLLTIAWDWTEVPDAWEGNIFSSRVPAEFKVELKSKLGDSLLRKLSSGGMCFSYGHAHRLYLPLMESRKPSQLARNNHLAIPLMFGLPMLLVESRSRCLTRFVKSESP